MRDGPVQEHRVELTARGLALGVCITVVFMAANVFMGLKTGLTFSSSIPAAVISMGALHLLGGGNILENNMVQTQASAAGTLCNIILVLPALVMVGSWDGFPFWQTTVIALLGGLLGVMYSIPLRRAMVIESDLPFPEGVAAAEVLRTGEGGETAKRGLRSLAAGGAAAALLSLAENARVLAPDISGFFTLGQAVFRGGAAFSLALVGVGYLVGIGACAALLVGVAVAWGVAVPLLSALHGVDHGGDGAAVATAIWTGQVRLIGAGIIAIAALWTVVTLFRPMARSIGEAIRTAGASRRDGGLPQQQRDLPITAVALTSALLALPLGVLLAIVVSGAGFGTAAVLGLAAGATLFTLLFGFLMATACGYMAGLLGSSSSPISGIGVLSTILVSFLFSHLGGGQVVSRALMATALFVTAVVVTIASIANDNLQDLKTGQIVGATPWRQQVVLIVGVVAGAAVIAPLLGLLYRTYGFVGHLPRPGMSPEAAMPAPQASLVAIITKGIFDGSLPWAMVLIGIGLGTVFLVLETGLRRRGRQFPTLTVGIGMYLPPTVAVTIAIGGVVGLLADRSLRRRTVSGTPRNRALEGNRRTGVLIASGFLVGESTVGMVLAGLQAAGGGSAPIEIGSTAFAPVAAALGAVIFALSLAGFYRVVSRSRDAG